MEAQALNYWCELLARNNDLNLIYITRLVLYKIINQNQIFLRLAI